MHVAEEAGPQSTRLLLGDWVQDSGVANRSPPVGPLARQLLYRSRLAAP
jgi:hypothetical protein